MITKKQSAEERERERERNQARQRGKQQAKQSTQKGGERPARQASTAATKHGQAREGEGGRQQSKLLVLVRLSASNLSPTHDGPSRLIQSLLARRGLCSPPHTLPRAHLWDHNISPRSLLWNQEV